MTTVSHILLLTTAGRLLLHPMRHLGEMVGVVSRGPYSSRRRMCCSSDSQRELAGLQEATCGAIQSVQALWPELGTRLGRSVAELLKFRGCCRLHRRVMEVMAAMAGVCCLSSTSGSISPCSCPLPFPSHVLCVVEAPMLPRSIHLSSCRTHTAAVYLQ